MCGYLTMQTWAAFTPFTRPFAPGPMGMKILRDPPIEIPGKPYHNNYEVLKATAKNNSAGQESDPVSKTYNLRRILLIELGSAVITPDSYVIEARAPKGLFHIDNLLTVRTDHKTKLIGAGFWGIN